MNYKVFLRRLYEVGSSMLDFGSQFVKVSIYFVINYRGLETDLIKRHVLHLEKFNLCGSQWHAQFEGNVRQSRRIVTSVEGGRNKEWDGIWGGVYPLQPTRGFRERYELHQRGPGPRKHIWAYFEVHRTLPFAPICRCFKLVKQCFMSHLGARPRLGGNYPCPT